VQYQSISPDPKRDADAAKLVEGAATWPVYTLKRDHGAFKAGTVFYGVPSRRDPERRWLANGVACQCPDYQQRGAMCAHVRAVRLHIERQQQEGSADQADPTLAPIREVRGRYADLFPECAAGCGDLVERSGERCYHCLSNETWRLEMAAKRAAVAMGV
jgi:hypothetical protein